MIVLPAQDPEVITPLFTTTPDKLEGTELVKNKLPPIPTPPVTVKAPVEVEVETVELEIIKSFVKVLIPANDWFKVETKPVDPIPAIGILNVWVEPDDDILNTLPEVPTEKYCCVAVKEFKVVIPVAAVGFQVMPNDAVLSAVRTKLLDPTGKGYNEVPAPTRISPKL